ncbi:54S ribosomal protein L19 [Yarrowia sp. B02]|nr:54S ribosomal protein L19 [Yarrowia sp. B02]
MAPKKAVQTANTIVKILVGAGAAKPQPPVGPVLGSKGVKAIDFCKEFNAKTAHYQDNIPIPVELTIKPDRSFTFEIKSPQTAFLLLRAAGAEKGAAKYKPGRDEPVGQLSLKHIYELAKVKKMDSRHKDQPLENICKSLCGTALSVGVEIVN